MENITEEQKQEADRIVSNIISKTKESLGSMVFSEFGYNHLGTTLAIQDRQSVFDKMLGLKSYISKADYHNVIRVEIQSLTNQIDYLKSKI